jgi:hypothetical protein
VGYPYFNHSTFQGLLKYEGKSSPACARRAGAGIPTADRAPPRARRAGGDSGRRHCRRDRRLAVQRLLHLKELERADVIAARREARSIIYTANFKTLRGLIRFLMEDCCASRAEICAPLSAPRAGQAPARKERADV